MESEDEKHQDPELAESSVEEKKTGAKFVSCALRFLCAAFPPEQACLVPSAPPAAHVADAFPSCRTTADRLSTSHATGKCYCRTFAKPTSSDTGPPIEALPEPLSQVCTRLPLPAGCFSTPNCRALIASSWVLILVQPVRKFPKNRRTALCESTRVKRQRRALVFVLLFLTHFAGAWLWIS